MHVMLQGLMRLLKRAALGEVRHRMARVLVLGKTRIIQARLVVVLESLTELLGGSTTSQI